MPSSSSLFSSLLFLFFTSYLIGVSSRKSLINHTPSNPPRSGFRVSLHHIDAGKNLTKIQKIQRGIGRGFHRLNKLGAVAMLAKASTHGDTNNIEAHTHAGTGEFLMDLAIGNPPVSYSAIVDTGSDLIWTQCKPCTECFDQPSPIFDPKKSSSYSTLGCFGSLCSALEQADCIDETCQYLYTYGDYSSTKGVLGTETFTFEKKNSVSGIGFGCGNDNEGDGFAQGSGLVGLGRGQLSLISQLQETQFSYCLTSIEDNEATSSLFIGSGIVNTSGVPDGVTQTTSLLRNSEQPSFYYLALQGISVGSKRLDIDESTFALTDDGSGGTIIDSGTTITYLEENAFKAVAKEFTSRMSLEVDDSGTTGLDLCFKLSENAKNVAVPKLIFHFKDMDLELPGENYMVADSSSGVMCLAMGSSNGMSIFGNVQQQNYMLIHDLKSETLSFVQTECGKL